MRIVHVISGIEARNGGPTSALMGLASAQQRAGLEVRVMATWQDVEAFRSAEKLESRGLTTRMIGPAVGKLSRHRDLASAVRQEINQADVVHVHAMWEQIQHESCRTAYQAGKPYVITPHGMLDPWNMRKSRFAKQAFLMLRARRNLQRAARLHFTTTIERDWVARLKLRPPAIVEPLGLDAMEYKLLPPAGSFRQKHREMGDRPIILFLGRIHYGKGLELLVPALGMMARADPWLLIAGPDSESYGAVIREVIAKHGVADRVIFTGMVTGEERLAILRDADLLALPSFHENFGLVVIEALACGTAVVVSDQVNLHPYITSHGLGGVTPLEEQRLATELDRWLNDTAARHHIRQTAPALVQREFNWDNIAAHWVSHYREIVSGRSKF